MRRAHFFRLFLCVTVVGLGLCGYMEHKNRVHILQMALFGLRKEVNLLKEEIGLLQYEVYQNESPHQLLKMIEHKEFSCLSYPREDHILIVPSKDNEH